MTNTLHEKSIPCEYCGSNNQRDAITCIACGAPLNNNLQPKLIDVEPIIQPKSTKPFISAEEEISQVVEKTDEVYLKVMNTYAIAWRTVGEAIAIAVSGFIIGVVGGATDVVFYGILGAITIGITVGLTQKIFLMVLISGPIASILGLLISAFLWIGGWPGASVFVVTIATVFGTLLGGKRRHPLKSRNYWEKARPILGALGGVFFGILGTILGLGIVNTIGFFSQ